MLKLASRLAFREMRGGIRGFRIFLACLALGVAAIGGAASLNESVQAGIEANAQPLLGGDLQVRLTTRAATEPELASMRRGGDVSHQFELRSMARTLGPDGQTATSSLVELKVVDDLYPLYGQLVLDPVLPLAEVLAEKDGLRGVAIEPALMTRLQIKVGDTVKIGEAVLQVRAAITAEPDRQYSFNVGGPRALIAEAALPATELVREGSLFTQTYNIRLNGSETAEQLRTRLRTEFPRAGWRVRGLNQAAQGIENALDNVTLFLTLVGMTALLTGGIGVANAVSAYLNGRMNVIATLKCLGAQGRLIFLMYGIQIAVLSAIGIALGLVVAAIVPPVVLPFIKNMIPVGGQVGLYPQSLGAAAIFGVLTSAVFALWPLARARHIPPVALFRQAVAGGPRPPLRYLVLLIVLGAALAAFAVLTAENVRFAFQFVVGVVAALLLYRLAAWCVTKVAMVLASGRRGPAVGRPTLRLALANLHRPGAPTTAVVVSLGLGLTVLVTVALLQTNLNSQIYNGLPKDAPSMVFMDLQPEQAEQFKTLVGGIPGVHKVTAVAMIRGRVSQINGVPADKVEADPEARWAVRGDRQLTHAATLPENARIVKGDWWPADHTGENLVSVDAAVAAGLGLDVGGTMAVNILGREIVATVANLRDIRWQSAQMNFTFIFSPNAMAGAPQNFVATANSDPGTEDRVERAVVSAMPNVSVIQVRAALDLVRQVLDSLSMAVQITAAVALLAGALVLASAIAAGQSRRIYEAVVLKVLGATRGDIVRAFLFEYGLLGFATGAISAGVGALAAWGVVTKVMRLSWQWDGVITAEVILACMALTLLAGLSGTWRALGTKAAPLLRNE